MKTVHPAPPPSPHPSVIQYSYGLHTKESVSSTRALCDFLYKAVEFQHLSRKKTIVSKLSLNATWSYFIFY